ncbi:MAG: glycosyltransferase family 61 protein [Rhodospirillales bacterium]|nr:glycosyltransferase family 61 protein [Rhodospirillales bacterium]
MTASPIGKRFAAHAVPLGPWAERAGYPIRHQPLEGRVPDSLLDPTVRRPWSRVQTELLAKHNEGYLVVEAGPVDIVLHDWTDERGTNATAYLFSTKGDLYIEDPHWLTILNGQGPIFQVLDAATSKVFFDLSACATVVEVDEPYLYLGGHDNFGHWMCEIVARLMGVCRQASDLLDLPFLFDKLTEPQRAFLRHLGFENPIRILQAPGARTYAYRFRHLFIAALPPCTFSFPLMHERIRRTTNDAKDGTGGRYFLSRRQLVPRHRIANEAAIETCLKAFGFETHLSDVFDPIADMRRIGQAEMLVLPYGAALGNLPMTGPECQIIVLGPDFLLTDRFEHPVLHYSRRYLFPFLDRLQLIPGTLPPNQPSPIDDRGDLHINLLQFDVPYVYRVEALAMAVLNAEKRLGRVHRSGSLAFGEKAGEAGR